MRAIKRCIYNKIISPFIRKHRMKGLTKYGDDVKVGKKCRFIGWIECGRHISIGEGAYFVSSRAKLIIEDNCVFGPNVTIYTGDHATHVIGKHILDISDEDKEKLEGEFDLDVVIEEGCWIGTRAIILKGVRVGKGSVIGAGAIVTKDVPPYSIYVGVPSMKILPRFTKEEILEHESRIAAERAEGLKG